MRVLGLRLPMRIGRRNGIRAHPITFEHLVLRHLLSGSKHERDLRNRNQAPISAQSRLCHDWSLGVGFKGVFPASR